LFGPATTPSEPVPPAGAPTPATTPAEEPDDLFGAPPATEEQPAEMEKKPAETPAEEPPAAEEDIFGRSRDILRQPGGLASTEMRTWVDNTGNYSCRGRIVRFLDGHVRLLKDNGRTTTVPLHRLSRSDLEFVYRQARAQQREGIQTVQLPVVMPPLDN